MSGAPPFPTALGTYLYRRRFRSHRPRVCVSAALSDDAPDAGLTKDDVVLEAQVGRKGYRTVQAWPPPKGARSAEGDVVMDVWVGRLARGERANTRCLVKEYRGAGATPENLKQLKGLDSRRAAARMAASEFAAHCKLQPPLSEYVDEHVTKLLGAFTADGAAWTVQRYDGCFETAGSFLQGRGEGGDTFTNADSWLDFLGGGRAETRRRVYLAEFTRQALKGVAHCHKCGILHGAIGEESFLVSALQDTEASRMRVWLTDLAFSVDIASSLAEWVASGGGGGEGGREDEDNYGFMLWRRAEKMGGCTNPEELRAYGEAEDVLAVGKLVLGMAVLPYARQSGGVTEYESFYRLLDSAFEGKEGRRAKEFRDYVSQDPGLAPAVEVLDMDGGAGWDFVDGLIDPDWRTRLTVQQALDHPFCAVRGGFR